MYVYKGDVKASQSLQGCDVKITYMESYRLSQYLTHEYSLIGAGHKLGVLNYAG